ncbi:ABC transporter substrate-binding protein [Lichenihabitans sp. Uapishka_5]|uniref:ABC transporter substrate-binding protein n=1 Tax=Lichenihabitans sp. Uapishka_5 TaxID=3037302 RepID=UPI0029E7ED78|nr:ABC transporter substrate-binding protein [Lichenihabitans sp. Uapishka_5]MDX7951756.1 ABC transporter substrate-binding protein [Lichenihabitans sp. Uapishka_5]
MVDTEHPAGWRNRLAMERRDVLRLLSGTLLAGSLPAGRAFAEDGELVVQNWGGAAEKAVLAGFAEPTKAVTGRTLVVDGSGSMAGKVKAMVEAKHVTVDIMDLPLGDGTQLGQAGLLEDIDYTIVDKSKVPDGFTTQWGIASYLFSYIFAVNEKRAKDKIPKTWADFWNTKDFPGKRGLPGYSQGVWEAALLADGVPPDQLYPLDLDRAIRKIKEIKPNAVFWKTGAQSEDLLRQGEVMASLMWSNRAAIVRRNLKTISWGWDGAILVASAWSAPKGNPAGRKAAMEFINLALDPKGQATVFSVVGMSPSNPAANALIPAEDQPFNAAAHTEKQVKLSDAWYAKHADEAEAMYIQAISS